MVAPRKQPSVSAARVLREMLLLGKKRCYGELLTAEEVARIPAPGLRAMVEARDVELLGDLEGTTPGREVANLRREVSELRERVAALEARPVASVIEQEG